MDNDTQQAISRHSLAVVRRRLDEIYEDPSNPRAHPPQNIAAIRASVRAFGQAAPLVVQRSTGRIIGGNGTYRALREEGALLVDVVELDLDDMAAARLGIALNRTSDTSAFDEPALGRLLAEIRAADLPVSDLGFGDEEIARLTEQARDAPVPAELPSEFRSYGEDIETDYACPKCGYHWSGSPKPESGLPGASDAGDDDA